jgi:eukaryotic-like serine/threonine-protein kinase
MGMMTVDRDAPHDSPTGRALGRYVLHDAISSGGMGSVHLGRLVGPVGFSRTVAIKRLHAHLAREPEFVAMFVDEARLAARIQHPNVVSTVDVVVLEGEIFLVMEYIQGESISKLQRLGGETPETIPPPIACAIAAGLLRGLHAAHEARGEHGQALDIVHRDVSPQNVMVGVDGTPRVFDFGVAKATARIQSTEDGKVKGKVAYMAPEQLRGKKVTRAADVYSASVVLWEMLTGRRLVVGDDREALVEQVLTGLHRPPSDFAAGLPSRLDGLVLRGLERDPQRRFATAEEMAIAIERVTSQASASEVGAWVREHADAHLSGRLERIARIEAAASHDTMAGLSGVLGKPSSSRSPRRSHLVAVAGAAAVLVTVGLVAAVTFRSPTEVRAAPASTPEAQEPSASAIASVAEPVKPAAPLPPSTPASASAASTSRDAPPPKRPGRPAHRECNPPYTRDAAGRVQWKVECL